MHDYTYVYENADKILKYYLDNPTNRQRFEDSEFIQVVSGLIPISQALKQLHTDGYVTIDGHHNNYYTITGTGTKFAKNDGYLTQFEKLNQKDTEQKSTDVLTARKLEIDLANAKRVYKTYFSTRAMAIIACIVSVCLLLLKLAEVFGWLSQPKQ